MKRFLTFLVLFSICIGGLTPVTAYAADATLLQATPAATYASIVNGHNITQGATRRLNNTEAFRDLATLAALYQSYHADDASNFTPFAATYRSDSLSRTYPGFLAQNSDYGSATNNIERAWIRRVCAQMLNMSRTYDGVTEEQIDSLSPEVYYLLLDFALAVDELGDAYPMLEKAYSYTNSDLGINNGLAHLFGLLKDRILSLAEETLSLDDTKYTLGTSKDDTILNRFYMLNTQTGITGLKFDEVVNDYTVSDKLKTTAKRVYDSAIGVTTDNPSKVMNGDPRDGVYTQEDSEEPITGIMLAVNEQNHLVGKNAFSNELIEGIDTAKYIPPATTETDKAPAARSTVAVSISDFITQGMTYSSTFIPLHTNLYNPHILSNFDKKFLKNFYYKYGFMRKAVYKDRSATAAADLYNNNGKSVGIKDICTLRDILNNGEDDLVLYIDDQFYNSDQTIDVATEELDANLRNMKKISEYLQQYFSAVNIMLKIISQATAPAEGQVVDKAEIAALCADAITNVPPFIQRAALASIDFDTMSVAATDMYAFRNNAVANQITTAGVETAAAVPQDIIDFIEVLKDECNFDPSTFVDVSDALKYSSELSVANQVSENSQVTDEMLKTNGYTSYDTNVVNQLYKTKADYRYKNLDIDLDLDEVKEHDNVDSIVFPSSKIQQYLNAIDTYSTSIPLDEDSAEADPEVTRVMTNTYESYTGYSPLMTFAYLSLLYRTPEAMTLANTLTQSIPIFMASDDLCTIDGADMWWKNSLLNYALLRNLPSSAQLDYNYVLDLDCPVYCDIFGNILTESGLVIIPAAANATLHTARFNTNNVAMGLYSVYGNNYYVPLNLQGAFEVMCPFFTVDFDSNRFIIDTTTHPILLGDVNVDYGDEDTSTVTEEDEMSTTMNDDPAPAGAVLLNYTWLNICDTPTQKAIMRLYQKATHTPSDGAIEGSSYTIYNWPTMVNIINEVMRGCSYDALDKEQEGIMPSSVNATSGIVAAAKLENLVDSLSSKNSNTLLSIPDFSRMDDMEFVVAFFIKLMIVATVIVIIIAVYRDGVSNQLGIRTIYKSLSAVVLTFLAVAMVPAIFQLTYYTANKLLLQQEACRILLYNLEKYNTGVELGITSTRVPKDTSDMALQLEWLSVPWYKQLEYTLFGGLNDYINDVREEAYSQTTVEDHYDVTLYNDGVYVTTQQLFDSCAIDFTFTDDASIGVDVNGNVVVRDQSSSTAQGEEEDGEDGTTVVSDISLLSTNRGANQMYLYAMGDLQTASYFTPYYAFLQVLVNNVNYYNAGLYYKADNISTNHKYINYYTKMMAGNKPKTVGLSNAYFTSEFFMSNQVDILHLHDMYEVDLGDTAYDDLPYFNEVDLLKLHNTGWCLEKSVSPEQVNARLLKLDAYARDFVTLNHDLITKVTDETFLKVMALYVAVKYNQLFGINSANAIEIYNMDSNDLLRLSIAKSDEAVLAAPLSYARYVHNFGGEPAVYAALILEMVVWIGSYIKPLCTIIVFITVFISIFVFRVVLRAPNHNMTGYIVTCLLLCATNIVHALLLKVSCKLPNFGFPTIACIIFLIIFQILYLLFLAYITGVALSDWQALGATKYETEFRKIKGNHKGDSMHEAATYLSGTIQHYDDGWNYYNDLISQHRSRNIE